MSKRRNKHDYQEVFSRYKVNENLKNADIIHIYGGKPTFKDGGYKDSRYMKIVFFNTSTMEKRETIEDYHDGIDLFNSTINHIKIYSDGSTLIKLIELHSIGIETQCISIYPLPSAIR
jgi:hypothetical protein